MRSFEPEPNDRAVVAEPQFLELVVPAESVIGLQVETALSSERAQVEDEVVAHVSRDVRVDDRVAIPSGAKAHGQVTLVGTGRATATTRRVSAFDSRRWSWQTVRAFRSRPKPFTAKAIRPAEKARQRLAAARSAAPSLAAFFGGAKGAVIGGSVGAGAGTAAVYAGGRNAATFTSGTPITVRLVEPATVTVEHSH